jgi:2-polyprenyl-3-methyl-5-hydroxy-6-metoxy-1,4-benzoquinol methylase
MQCKVCQNELNNKEYSVKEMMFGWDESLKYLECGRCKAVQLLDDIADMSKYYPENYYSFNSKSHEDLGGIKKTMMQLRDKFAVLNSGTIGKILYNRKPSPNLRLLSEINLNLESKILDVGCGDGKHLSHLDGVGFKNLLGADPFIEDTINFGNGHKIVKKTFQELDGKFDLIMFHHSFEHMPNPKEILQSVHDHLEASGTCMIRIPTASSYAWEKYRENWVQLDAPRHYFLHTQESMEHLANECGLKIEKCIYDSTGFQFWGSEQCVNGIPLTDPKSHSLNTANSMYSETEIAPYNQQAQELNAKNQGDACAFFLKKK